MRDTTCNLSFSIKEKQFFIVQTTNVANRIYQIPYHQNVQIISFTNFKGLIDNLNRQTKLLDAILFDLKSIAIHDLIPVLKKIKKHSLLKKIPLIGLHYTDSVKQRRKLIELGFSDCYNPPFNWQRIENRITFLNKYRKEMLEAERGNIDNDELYKIPPSKRIFDVIVATILLILLFPLFLIVTLLIKLESRGGVFYFSKRVGTGYQVFNLIKFRSMCLNADTQLMQLLDTNSYSESNKANAFYKIKDDPRKTIVGKFIRKTSIDELPQLINVLKGEMSIIGNRPLPLYEAQNLTNDDWAKRFLAPAGITGLWQVDKRGKHNLSAEERIQLDIDYANNYSFLLDLKILFLTPPAMLQED